MAAASYAQPGAAAEVSTLPSSGHTKPHGPFSGMKHCKAHGTAHAGLLSVACVCLLASDSLLNLFLLRHLPDVVIVAGSSNSC